MNNSLEYFLLDCGFSWTLSKFLPYVVLLLLGGFGAWLLRSLMLQLWIKIGLMVLTLSFPFSIYFFFYPIYQPDLASTVYRPEVLPPFTEQKANLVVVVLPGCPYCEASVETMNRLHQQNPGLKIRYYLVSEDPTAIADFKKRLDAKIEVVYQKEAPLWMLAAEGVFPSYLLFDNKQLKAAWHNTTFGVRALDFLRAYN